MGKNKKLVLPKLKAKVQDATLDLANFSLNFGDDDKAADVEMTKQGSVPASKGPVLDLEFRGTYGGRIKKKKMAAKKRMKARKEEGISKGVALSEKLQEKLSKQIARQAKKWSVFRWCTDCAQQRIKDS